MFSHINSDHLLEICRRIGNTMQRENNSISHVPSLLGMGNHSLIKKDGKSILIRYFLCFLLYLLEFRIYLIFSLERLMCFVNII